MNNIQDDTKLFVIICSLLALVVFAITIGISYNNYLHAQLGIKAMKEPLIQCRQPYDHSIFWAKECK